MRGVTIREDVKVGRADHKVPGGLVTAEIEVGEGVILGLSLSGDFTFRPKDCWDGLAAVIAGTRFAREPIERVVGEYYAKNHVDCPGVSPLDVAEAILKATG